MIVPNNTNYSSSQVAAGTFLKSLTTFSGTTWWTGYISAGSSIALEEGRIVMPANATHAITIQAPTGNTSMKVAVNIAFYYLDGNLIQ